MSGYVTVQLDLSRFCRLTAGTTIPYTLWNTVVSHQLDPSVRFPSHLSELIQGLHVGLMSSVSSMSKPMCLRDGYPNTLYSLYCTSRDIRYLVT